jgi:hypothetical protein
MQKLARVQLKEGKNNEKIKYNKCGIDRLPALIKY